MSAPEEFDDVPARYRPAFDKLSELSHDLIALVQDAERSPPLAKSDVKTVVDAHHALGALRQQLCIPPANVDRDDFIHRAAKSAERTLKCMTLVPPPGGYHEAVPPKLEAALGAIGELVSIGEAIGRGRG